MNTQDQEKFAGILAQTMALYGRETTPQVIELWWRLMAEVSIEDFARAMETHARTSRHAPLPADVLSQTSRYPSPEEAWNAAPKSESEGAWVFQEMMEALSACQDSLNRGDYVAARMAFIERYKSAVAGKTGEPRRWLSRPNGQTEAQMMDFEERAALTEPCQAGSLYLAQIKRRLTHSGSSGIGRVSKLASGALQSIAPASETS